VTIRAAVGTERSAARSRSTVSSKRAWPPVPGRRAHGHRSAAPRTPITGDPLGHGCRGSARGRTATEMPWVGRGFELPFDEGGIASRSKARRRRASLKGWTSGALEPRTVLGVGTNLTRSLLLRRRASVPKIVPGALRGSGIDPLHALARFDPLPRGMPRVPLLESASRATSAKRAGDDETRRRRRRPAVHARHHQRAAAGDRHVVSTGKWPQTAPRHGASGGRSGGSPGPCNRVGVADMSPSVTMQVARAPCPSRRGWCRRSSRRPRRRGRLITRDLARPDRLDAPLRAFVGVSAASTSSRSGHVRSVVGVASRARPRAGRG